ncbi:MAG TPA: hypothetical protein VK057_03405 [Bacillota bacterium]|nr:hypothetical protein [Bacillota bacterium]
MTDCPLCNGFSEWNIQCTNCSDIMEDLGKVSDYFDDYSPYLDLDKEVWQENTVDHDEQCTHLYYCPTCGEEHIQTVSL